MSILATVSITNTTTIEIVATLGDIEPRDETDLLNARIGDLLAEGRVDGTVVGNFVGIVLGTSDGIFF